MSTLDGGIGRWLRVISILITLLASVAHGDALSTRSKQLHNRLKDARKHAANDIRKSHTMLYMTHGGGDENYRHSVDDDQSNARRAGRVVALSAALGSLMQGYDTGVIGGALLFIEPEFGLSAKPLLLGMIVTATTMGSIGGTLAASKLSDNIGRRSTMLLASAKFIAASAILSFAPGVKALIAGRLLMGVAIGEASSVVPVYIAECADKRNRGALATIPQLCISSGILLAYTVSLWVSICFRGAWRLMMGMAIFPAIAQFLCVSTQLPESPRWLLSKKGDVEGSRRALARLRGSPNPDDPSAAVLAEYQELSTGIEREVKQQAQADSPSSQTADIRTGWAALCEPKIFKLMAVCMVLQVFQQFTGINAVVYFTPQTLKEAGVPVLFSRFGLNDDAASLLATTIAYIPKIPALFLAMKLMDSMGRRRLLQAFVPVMGASLLGLAGVFSVLGGSIGSGVKWIPSAVALACIMTYGCSFALSLGPIPNILTSELFPTRCRSAAMSASLGAQFAANTAVGLAFPVLRHKFGTRAVFAGFGVTCAVAWLFINRFVPETKGLALEDLSD